MRTGAILLGLLAVAGGGGALRAQDPRLERLDPQARAAVRAIVDSARSAGLPSEPLVDRALEGATKRAPPELIIAALRRLAEHLGRARDALGAGASAAEIEAGAAALRAGADPAVLGQLRRSRPRQSLTVPLAVLADLVTSGVPLDTAAAAVLALAPLTPDDALLEFRRTVARDIALGASPAAAATVRVSDLGYDAAAPGPGRAPSRPRRP